MTDILLMFGIVVVIIGLIIGLFFLLKIEIRKYKDEKLLLSEEVVSIDVFNQLINRAIKRRKKKDDPFTLMLVDLDEFQEIVDTFNKEEETFIETHLNQLALR